MGTLLLAHEVVVVRRRRVAVHDDRVALLQVWLEGLPQLRQHRSGQRVLRAGASAPRSRSRAPGRPAGRLSGRSSSSTWMVQASGASGRRSHSARSKTTRNSLSASSGRVYTAHHRPMLAQATFMPRPKWPFAPRGFLTILSMSTPSLTASTRTPRSSRRRCRRRRPPRGSTITSTTVASPSTAASKLLATISATASASVRFVAPIFVEELRRRRVRVRLDARHATPTLVGRAPM